MKTVYQANDGSIFNSAEECVAYENKALFKFYDNYGCVTDNPDAAYIVRLFGDDLDYAADLVCKLFKFTCSSYKGIVPFNGEDTFYWNYNERKYVPMPAYLIDAIREMEF